MSEPVTLLSARGAALIDEHAQRFSIMVAEDVPADEAVARTAGDLVSALGMGERGATMLLWMAVLDLTCEIRVEDG